MIATWVKEEFRTLNLRDARRNRCGQKLATMLEQHPSMSIPAAVGGGGNETTQAYRFFGNEKIEASWIIEPHFHATRERICDQKVCILIQDTSEMDLTRPTKQVEGAGPLDGGARYGCLLHPLFALTEEGLPLGTADLIYWTRDKASLELDAKTKRQLRKAAPIDEKESMRWIEGMRKAHEIANLCPDTQCILLSDSEADIYEMLVEGCATGGKSQFIVRGCQNRAVAVPKDAAEDTAKTLLDAVLLTSVRATYEIHVRGRDTKVSCEERSRRCAREPRKAIVEVRATTITLRPTYRLGQKLPPVTVNVVLVREVNPPEGEAPIEWLLITDLPITTTEEILRVAKLYTHRWQIEIFFRILKQGCRIEERRFEHIARWERFAMFNIIIAWRTYHLTIMGRSFPDMDCEVAFSISEWKAVYYFTQKRQPPKKPPSLRVMIRMVAQLGGYVNRSRKDAPGPETILKGLHRMHDLAYCWDLFGPDSDFAVTVATARGPGD